MPSCAYGECIQEARRDCLFKGSAVGKCKNNLAIATSSVLHPQKGASGTALFVLARAAAGLLQPGLPTDLRSLSADKQAWLIVVLQVSFEGSVTTFLSLDSHITSACPACVLTCITAFSLFLFCNLHTAMLALSRRNLTTTL